MQAKFGFLSPKVKQHVQALSPETLTQLQLDLLNAQAIGELRLGDSLSRGDWTAIELFVAGVRGWGSWPWRQLENSQST
jgi:hypothetical protein